MIDQEKVINGLECCVDDKPFYHAHCDECPYNGCRSDNMGGCTQLYRDALELLKEQKQALKREYKQDMSDLERKEEELFVEALIDLWIQNDAPQWMVDYVRKELRKQRGLSDD